MPRPLPRPLRDLRGRGVGGPGKWGKIGFYRHSEISLFLTTFKEVAEIEIYDVIPQGIPRITTSVCFDFVEYLKILLHENLCQKNVK